MPRRSLLTGNLVERRVGKPRATKKGARNREHRFLSRLRLASRTLVRQGGSGEPLIVMLLMVCMSNAFACQALCSQAMSSRVECEQGVRRQPVFPSVVAGH